MKNIMTFDIEDWYHANYEEVDSSVCATYEERVQEPTRKILQLLKKTKTSATFFVLGHVAERFPKLISEIADEGHEVASHGYNHKLVYKQTREEFIEDIGKSKHILENIIGEKIIGYRAPSWSVSVSKTPWAWKSLKDVGFLYDSSIFPFKTFLYGDGKSNPYSHEIYLEGNKSIYEAPPSIIKFFNARFPFSGGFYFRLLPLKVIEFGIRRLNRKSCPAILYLHPREIDTEQPKLRLNFRNNFIHYYNIKNTENKLCRLLSRHKFTSIEDMFFGITNLSAKGNDVGR